MMSDNPYAVSENIEGGDLFAPRWVAAAAAFRAAMGARMETVSYGDTDRQAVDLFWPQGQARGVLVFVHGGFWKSTDKSLWSHLAAGAVQQGWAVAMPGYDLCPDVRVAQITRQIARAIEVVSSRVAGPMALTGHSAGGHLVARMTAPGLLPEDVRARIKRLVPISPLADLEPLLDIPYNDDLRLDRAEARAESPVHMDRPKGVDVEVWVGADETPAFLDQAKMLAEAWGVKQVSVPGKHHFDVIGAFEDPDSALIRRLCGG